MRQVAAERGTRILSHCVVGTVLMESKYSDGWQTGGVGENCNELKRNETELSAAADILK